MLNSVGTIKPWFGMQFVRIVSLNTALLAKSQGLVLATSATKVTFTTKKLTNVRTQSAVSSTVRTAPRTNLAFWDVTNASKAIGLVLCLVHAKIRLALSIFVMIVAFQDLRVVTRASMGTHLIESLTDVKTQCARKSFVKTVQSLESRAVTSAVNSTTLIRRYKSVLSSRALFHSARNVMPTRRSANSAHAIIGLIQRQTYVLTAHAW